MKNLLITSSILLLWQFSTLASQNCLQGDPKILVAEEIVKKCDLSSAGDFIKSIDARDSRNLFYTKVSFVNGIGRVTECGRKPDHWKVSNPICHFDRKELIMINHSGNETMNDVFNNSKNVSIHQRDIERMINNKGLNGWGDCFWSEEAIKEGYAYHRLNGLVHYYGDLWLSGGDIDNNPANITLNRDCPRTFVINSKLQFSVLRGSYRLKSAENYVKKTNQYSESSLKLINGEVFGLDGQIHLRKVIINNIDFFTLKRTFTDSDYIDYSLFYSPEM